MTPEVEPVEMQIALKRVQSLDPLGVGARNVAECLTLQLPSIDDEDERELAGAIIAGHLDRLAQHDVNGLARLLKRTPADDRGRLRAHPPPQPAAGLERRADRDAVHHARRDRAQDPRPLDGDAQPRRRAARQAQPVLCVDVPGASRRRPRRDGAAPAGCALDGEERAAALLDDPDGLRGDPQAPAALPRVRADGDEAARPARDRDELGLHESTVSRVTNNKYMATPVGVFELKYFFSREMATASGGACSATAIRGVIKGMIEAENPVDPLSDAQIARLLVRQGLKVARRTVTKYRQLLKVASVERRRRVGRPMTEAPA